jgi:hypothetical protein
MEVRVKRELLAPGMQDGEKTDASPRCWGSAAISSKVSEAQRNSRSYSSRGWLNASGLSSSGRVKTTWKYGTGSNSAQRCSSHCAVCRLWHFGQ